MRILLVEDHADTARVLSRLLGLDGHVVTVAPSCAAAVEKYAAAEFDLCLIDRALPDGDGCDLLARLVQTRPTVAIMLSGHGMREDVQAAMTRGFAGYIVKPATIDTIRAEISRAIKPSSGGDDRFLSLDRF